MQDQNERRVIQERVVQTPQGSAATIVDQRTNVIPSPAERATGRLLRSQQAVWLVFVILDGLLAVRFLLIAMGADMKLGFGLLLYSFTQPFALPFLLLFGDQGKAAAGHSYVEFGSVIAVVVYLLLAWTVTRVVGLIMSPRVVVS